MLAYLIRSFAQAVIVLLAVALIAFSMFRFVGDPVANMVGQETSQADVAELRKRLGLDDPVPVQFARYVGNVLNGDLGMSYRQGRKVSDLLAEKLPATVELAVLSALFATVLGTVLGVYTAIHRKSWLPSNGRGEVVKLGWWSTGLLTESGRKSLIMPVLTLSFFQLTLIMRLVRAQMLETLRTDYVKFARARGLSETRVHYKHALRNTLIPVVTIAGLQLGSVIAFAIITESVFQWPGLGALFVQAVQFVDIPVMATYLLFVAVVFVVVNLLVDFAYALLDPRLRSQTSGAGK